MYLTKRGRLLSVVEINVAGTLHPVPERNEARSADRAESIRRCQTTNGKSEGGGYWYGNDICGR